MKLEYQNLISIFAFNFNLRRYVKERYEQKLASEREVGLRLKGENGIMKKKFNNLQKDINEQKDEIQQLFDQKKDLYSTISSLEKDINGLKKEIKVGCCS